MLEKMHKKGYIHCDLKPENIMIGNFDLDPRSKNEIYLIDFGIAQRYVDECGRHIRFRKNVGFKGNVVFSSKNAFGEVTLSRRDDFISLIYLLIYCIDTNVEWFDNDRELSG